MAPQDPVPDPLVHLAYVAAVTVRREDMEKRFPGLLHAVLGGQ
jgi:hypothetical protein